MASGIQRSAMCSVMYATSAPNDSKCVSSSCVSSMTKPNRSSMAIDISMKSSESSPSDPSIPLGKTVARVSSEVRLGSNLRRSTMMSLSSSSTFSASMTRLPPEGGHTLSVERVTDVEKIEPLSRVVSNDVLEERAAGLRGVFRIAAPDGEWRGYLHQVPIARGEQAERRHERDPDGAGQQERSHREGRRPPEKRNHRIASGAEGPIALDGHDLAAPQRGDQLERDRRTGPRDEADAFAIPSHPALQLSHLLGCHDHVRRPGALTGQESPRQLPVPHVRGGRDEASREAAEPLHPFRPRDVGCELRPRLPVCRDQVAETHGEIDEYLSGERVQPGSRGVGELRQSLPDGRAFRRHEPRREPPDLPRESEA